MGACRADVTVSGPEKFEREEEVGLGECGGVGVMREPGRNERGRMMDAWLHI